MKPCIFLDRDGVINKAEVIDGIPHPPLSGVYPIKGIKKLVEEFHKNGYIVVVITNQPDVAADIITKNRVRKINNYLRSIINFDDIFVCYHSPEEGCECRKPKVGLFLDAIKKYDIDLSKSWMIGDRWKDIEAGNTLGLQTIFIDYGYNEQQPESPNYVVKDISEISEIILKENK